MSRDSPSLLNISVFIYILNVMIITEDYLTPSPIYLLHSVIKNISVYIQYTVVVFLDAFIPSIFQVL